MRMLENRTLRCSGEHTRLGFATTGGGHWPQWDRFLTVDGAHAVHLGNVCDTCPFWFERLAVEAPPVDVAALTAALAAGLEDVDGVERAAKAFSPVLPAGDYLAARFATTPRLVGPDGARDYFTSEQREAWSPIGMQEPAAAAPGYRDPYYRDEDFEVAPGERLFEFLIPLLRTDALDPARVDHYRQTIRGGARPTAVALGVVDVKTAEDWPIVDGQEVEPDFPVHWCFANHLVDGHHKVFAAHLERRPITLLSFIARDHSWPQAAQLPPTYAARGRGDR